MKMNFLRTEKLPSSWGISIVVHFLVFLALFIFLPSPTQKAALGERETGEIGLFFNDSPQIPQNSDINNQSQSPQPSIDQPQTVDQILEQQKKAFQPQEPNAAIDVPSVIGPVTNINTPNPGKNPFEGATSGKTGGSGKLGVTGSFMGAQGTGSKFVYVLDRSASTGIGGSRSPLAVAKRELLTSLEGLLELGEKKGQLIQFQIIFFNNETEIYDPNKNTGNIPILDEKSLELARRFIGGIVPTGGTIAGPALVKALQQRGDVIFFRTDGATKISPADLARIQKLSRGEQINVIEYGTKTKNSGYNSLQQLADENHGGYIYVDISK